MHPTLKTIAAQANVSVATVSRILNDAPSAVPIRTETRERVLRIAAELGYRPNLAARSLAQRSSLRLIGAIMPKHVPHALSHPFYFTILQGIANYCEERGYGVVVCFISLDGGEDDYSRLLELPVDGFILTTTRETDTLLPRLIHDGVPLVHIGRFPNSSVLGIETAFVDVDNYQGARLAVEHIVRLGHRRVATITGQLSMAAGQDRLRAYEDVLHEAGLPIDRDLIREGDFDEPRGHEAMLQLLDVTPRPTAIFAASDAMAFGALRALRERRLTVPSDVAVVGYDDSPGAETTDPPLTTVRQPVLDLGEAAARLLIHRVTGEGERPSSLLTPILVIRKSCDATRPA
jgi:LacI family transcriptional regulator